MVKKLYAGRYRNGRRCATEPKRIGATPCSPTKKMSLSLSTGPYFGRPHPARLQTARLEGAAATELTAAVCLQGTVFMPGELRSLQWSNWHADIRGERVPKQTSAEATISN